MKVMYSGQEEHYVKMRYSGHSKYCVRLMSYCPNEHSVKKMDSGHSEYCMRYSGKH